MGCLNNIACFRYLFRIRYLLSISHKYICSSKFISKIHRILSMMENLMKKEKPVIYYVKLFKRPSIQS